MSVSIKSLEKITIPEIHSCFVEAFSDYLVDISYMTPDVMKNRFIKNGFLPELSAGVFEENILKGFTVVGKGMFKENLAAFDIMTGLVKEYRGKGLANKMFYFILETMKDQTMNTFFHEVLQENKSAIKAYTKTGFKKTRGFNCYSLKLARLRPAKSIQTVIFINNASKNEIDSFVDYLDWEPSWENHFESIKRIKDDLVVIVARANSKNIGLLVYYPTLKWVLALVVDPKYRRKGVASALLEYLYDYLPIYIREIKLLNVQDSDSGMNHFLTNSGFELLTGQYEMEFKL